MASNTPHDPLSCRARPLVHPACHITMPTRRSTDFAGALDQPRPDDVPVLKLDPGFPPLRHLSTNHRGVSVRSETDDGAYRADGGITTRY